MMDDRRDELASAYLDGEADPDETARVEGDQELLDRVAVLRAAAAAVAVPPEPRPEADRDAAITRALATAGAPTWSPVAGTTAAPGTDPGGVVSLDAARARRGAAWGPRLRVASVAAAVLAVAVLAPLLAGLGDEDDPADRAGGTGEAPTLEATADDAGQSAQTEAAGGGGAMAASTIAPPFGPDLPHVGALESQADLDAAAGTLVALRSGGGDEQGTPGAPTTTFAVVADTDTTTNDCLVRLAGDAEVEAPVAAARATWQDQPALVLVYRRTDGSLGAVAALEDGCRIVARA